MTALQEFLRDAGGVATVEAFMRWALHDPQYGYYARRVSEIGRAGDFSTSATLSPALGRAIAAWAIARKGELAWRGPWHFIELGPGGGQLAAEILHELGRWPHRRVIYHLVETSKPLKEQQRALLAPIQRGLFRAELRWHADIATALREASGNALIVSNEFVDAFPCAVFARSPENDGWREVAIRWNDRSAQAEEMFLPVASERAADIQPTIVALPSGVSRIEIHLAYRDWSDAWRPHWREGRMLTIDYGDAADSLYQRRPGGTLRGFFRQQRVEGTEIYERPGAQDLTADVNFTDLARWGETVGLCAEPLINQREFILRWIPQTTLRDAATTHVLNPDGAGGAFKVLEQAAAR